MRDEDEIMASQWKYLRGKLKERWHGITDQDIKVVDGNRSVLLEILQERYSCTPYAAEEEVRSFLKEFGPAPNSSR
ncbi:MAG: CsbD family protein [Chloroflexi bacterium]|nr:CsbD family protein [Chloroflexota bacterium]